MAKGKRRNRRPRRPKYSAEQPLELEVAVPSIQQVPASALGVALARPVEAFFDAMPEVADTASGRQKAQTIRAVLGLTALLLVIAARDGQTWLGVLGVCVGVVLVFVPMSGLRKARWKHRLKRITGGRERRVHAAASLRFDGTKLTIRGADGKIWRSARPLVPPFVVVWGGHEGVDWLGIVNPKGKKREALWFSSSAGADRLADQPPLATALAAHVQWSVDGNVEVAQAGGDAFEALCAALGPLPPSGGAGRV